MPKLTVYAYANVALQDPFPSEGAVTFNLTAGNHAHKDVTWTQLQRMRDVLNALETSGTISYTIETEEIDSRTDESHLVGLPTLDVFTPASFDPTKNETVTVTGTNLLGFQTKATGVIGDPTDPDGHIHFTAVNPGAAGNMITIEVAHKAGAGVTVTVVGREITIEYQTAVDTYADIDAALTASPDAQLLIAQTLAGAGTTVASDETEVLSGGVGPGITIQTAGVDGVLTSVTDTELVFVTGDMSAYTPDYTANMYIRTGGQLLSATVILI